MSKGLSVTVAFFQTAALVAFAVCVTVCASVVLLLVMRTRPIYGDFCRAAHVCGEPSLPESSLYYRL